MESAPAVVVLKDPGVKPIVYHGMLRVHFLFIVSFDDLLKFNLPFCQNFRIIP